MSEETVQGKRHRINIEKVQDFFDTHGISVECLVCKTDEWRIPHAHSTGGNALPWGTGAGEMYMTGLPVLVMICKKCKFVRQHSLLDDDLPGAVEVF